MKNNNSNFSPGEITIIAGFILNLVSMFLPWLSDSLEVKILSPLGTTLMVLPLLNLYAFLGVVRKKKFLKSIAVALAGIGLAVGLYVSLASFGTKDLGQIFSYKVKIGLILYIISQIASIAGPCIYEKELEKEANTD